MTVVHLKKASLQNDDSTVTSSASRSSFNFLDNIKHSSKFPQKSRSYNVPADPRLMGPRLTSKSRSYPLKAPDMTFSTMDETASTHSLQSASSSEISEKLNKTFSLFKTSSSTGSALLDSSAYSYRDQNNFHGILNDEESSVEARLSDWDTSEIFSAFDGDGDDISKGRTDMILRQLAISESESELVASSHVSDYQTSSHLETVLSPASSQETSSGQYDKSSIGTDTDTFFSRDGTHQSESFRSIRTLDDDTFASDNFIDGVALVGKVAYAVGTGNCHLDDVLDSEDDCSESEESDLETETPPVLSVEYDVEKELVGPGPRKVLRDLFSCTGVTLSHARP